MQSLRRMVVPFWMAFLPALWYVNRNVLNENLPPALDPTLALVALAVGAGVAGSLVWAAFVAVVSRRPESETYRDLPYRQRVFAPDDTALTLFAVFLVIAFGWAFVELADVGPPLLGTVATVLVVPLGLPMVVLLPFAIHFHWAVILGLALSAAWMSLLSVLCSDLLHRLSNPSPNDGSS